MLPQSKIVKVFAIQEEFNNKVAFKIPWHCNMPSLALLCYNKDEA